MFCIYMHVCYKPSYSTRLLWGHCTVPNNMYRTTSNSIIKVSFPIHETTHFSKFLYFPTSQKFAFRNFIAIPPPLHFLKSSFFVPGPPFSMSSVARLCMQHRIQIRGGRGDNMNNTLTCTFRISVGYDDSTTYLQALAQWCWSISSSWFLFLCTHIC